MPSYVSTSMIVRVRTAAGLGRLTLSETLMRKVRVAVNLHLGHQKLAELRGEEIKAEDARAHLS